MTTKAERARAAQDLLNRKNRLYALLDHKGYFKDAFDDYMSLARAAESLRKRYEAECSYEWADTEAYRKRTETQERNLVARVEALGLHAYIQSDPRGATLYVDKEPLTCTNYNTGLCVYI